MKVRLLNQLSRVGETIWNGSAVHSNSALPGREFRLWSDFGTASTKAPNFLSAKTNAKIIITYFASSLTQ